MDCRALLVVIHASFVSHHLPVCSLALPCHFPFSSPPHTAEFPSLIHFFHHLQIATDKKNISPAWWQAPSISSIVKARLTEMNSKCGWCHLALALAVHCMFTRQLKRFSFSMLSLLCTLKRMSKIRLISLSCYYADSTKQKVQC